MHELAVTNEILEIILRYAAAENVTRIHTVTLEIGELSDLQGKWLQRYFAQLSADTVAADAKIQIDVVPALFVCDACSARFKHSLKTESTLACPECGHESIHLTSGDEYIIRNMEAE